MYLKSVPFFAGLLSNFVKLILASWNSWRKLTKTPCPSVRLTKIEVLSLLDLISFNLFDKIINLVWLFLESSILSKSIGTPLWTAANLEQIDAEFISLSAYFTAALVLFTGIHFMLSSKYSSIKSLHCLNAMSLE